MFYEFEWDPTKAKTNITKHGVHFESATDVFKDPLALTIPDEEHSLDEVRWVTLGKDMAGGYLLVIHTFQQIAEGLVRMRVISARRPTRVEIQEYEDGR